MHLDASASPLWRFSLDIYQLAGVAELCLRMQDEADIDVNLLLALMWLASRQRAVSEEECARLASTTQTWQRNAVTPLRTLRRWAKETDALDAPTAVQAFRTQVKALELEAERLEQEALFRAISYDEPGHDVTDADAAVRGNLAALAGCVNAPLPADARDVFSRAVLEVSNHD